MSSFHNSRISRSVDSISSVSVHSNKRYISYLDKDDVSYKIAQKKRINDEEGKKILEEIEK